ncbi:MAG: aldo/keto reductase [Saprospiraceae bacterium]
MLYEPQPSRYTGMSYRRCGNSGLMLPIISLGLWHNFGDVDDKINYKKIIYAAFDHGITHFDLANNYGPPSGSAEKNFGDIIQNNLKPYRDEMIISTKAGYRMWPGPYGEWGSRKYLISSLDQSLKRLNLDYVDVFYSHRYDPKTPLEETMEALASIYRAGKTLYIGISNYGPKETKEAYQILQQKGIPLLIHQPKYSMLVRDPEDGLLDVLEDKNIGCIPFSPLAQGLLTSKYLKSIPNESRMAKEHGFLQEKDLTTDILQKINGLNKIAETRNQSLAQMAVAWLLNKKTITSVLVGASSPAQLKELLGASQQVYFANEELENIQSILNSGMEIK